MRMRILESAMGRSIFGGLLVFIGSPIVGCEERPSTNRQPLTNEQSLELLQPYPFVPGIYELKAKHSSLCIGRWSWGSQSLQQVDCGTPNAQLAFFPVKENGPISVAGMSSRYTVHPAFIRTDETQSRPPGDLSLCATYTQGAGPRPVYSRRCIAVRCQAADLQQQVEFIDRGGFSAAGGEVLLYSMEMSTPPETLLWSVRDARTDLSADVLIWGANRTNPPNNFVFTPKLLRAFSQAEFTNCSTFTNVSSAIGWHFTPTSEWRYIPAARGADLPGNSYREETTFNDAGTACGKKCAEEANCRAFTWREPNSGQGPAPLCSLKNAVPSAVSDQAAVSGVVRP